jgi:hypothetical protein
MRSPYRVRPTAARSENVQPLWLDPMVKGACVGPGYKPAWPFALGRLKLNAIWRANLPNT